MLWRPPESTRMDSLLPYQTVVRFKDMLTAWGEAYWLLANILIAREDRIYTEQKDTAGGWNGWRDFRVEDVIRESSVINSFILRPVDGGPVMANRPGQ